MASIKKEIVIDASVDAIWDAVRDTGAVHTRLMPAFISEARLDPDGGARSCTMADGSPLRELIVDIDDSAHRLVYSIVESPIPMSHHSASMQVFEEADGRARFVWISDFLPDEFAAIIGQMIDEAAQNIDETLGTKVDAGRTSGSS